MLALSTLPVGEAEYSGNPALELLATVTDEPDRILPTPWFWFCCCCW
jgi:hypothetical protein